jgi:hypothetical protein
MSKNPGDATIIPTTPINAPTNEHSDNDRDGWNNGPQPPRNSEECHRQSSGGGATGGMRDGGILD